MPYLRHNHYLTFHWWYIVYIIRSFNRNNNNNISYKYI